jgi:hypothetical protein
MRGQRVLRHEAREFLANIVVLSANRPSPRLAIPVIVAGSVPGIFLGLRYGEVAEWLKAPSFATALSRVRSHYVDGR